MTAPAQRSRDLTAWATPLYFLSMFVEHRALVRRRAQLGPSAGDYETRDTMASLAMGQASLFAPLVMPRLVRLITPGRGRWARIVLGAAAVSAGVATAADVWSRRRLRRSDGPSVETYERAEKKETTDDVGSRRTTAGVASVVALTLGGIAITSWWNNTLTPARFHARAPRRISNDKVALAVALVGWDFLYYWNHRFMHSCRYMWAMHVVHHSSERYNLSTALRQPVADVFTTPLPYGLVCLLGVSPDTLKAARDIDLLWQFWIHTETIEHIGIAETLLNSPSAHRVHHGSNRQYLDRNHGGILIVWDRLFGTYEPEDERVVYGLTKNIKSFRPLVIVAHEYGAIARDVARARTWRDRVSYVVRGPGWQPHSAEHIPPKFATDSLI